MSLYISDPHARRIIIRVYPKSRRKRPQPLTPHPKIPVQVGSSTPFYADFFGNGPATTAAVAS